MDQSLTRRKVFLAGRIREVGLALHQSQAQGLAMPKFTWDFEESPAGLTIAVKSEPPPHQFRVWTAFRPTADLRAGRWTSAPLPATDGSARHLVPRTADFQGVFVEAEFRTGRPLPLNLSTLVRVIATAPAVAAPLESALDP